MKEELIEGLHYYIDAQNRWVFTAYYLQQRGYCCQNACLHCPYGFTKKTEQECKQLDKHKKMEQ